MKAARLPPYTREDTMIAFNLYSKIPLGKVRPHHPDVIKLAKILNRPPGSVAWKINNLASSDKQRIERGLKGTRIASVELEVWEAFRNNPSKFMQETEELLMNRSGESPEDLPLAPGELPELVDLPPGETRRRLANARANQNLFRKMVLAVYNNQCCITGIAAPELLNASHIVPWRDNPKERTNPRNGLCLNALHDRAFDRGLISVSPELIVAVSPKLQEAAVAKNASDKIQFLVESDGKPITQPQKFAPDPEFLTHHYRKIFQR